MAKGRKKDKSITQCLGISDKRYEELNDICRASWQKRDVVSDVIADIAGNKKLNAKEKVFCGYMVGHKNSIGSLMHSVSEGLRGILK